EREALIAIRVVADTAQDVRVDHPATRRLDPAVAATGVALRILAVADEAGERDLGRRLGEREVVGAEAHVLVGAEVLAREGVEHALQVRHAEVLVDRETLVLEEDALADRIGRIVAVAAPGDDDTDRRLAP